MLFSSTNILSIDGFKGNKNPSLKIFYRLPQWCNFHCSYCTMKSFEKDKPKEEDIKKDCQQMINQLQVYLKNINKDKSLYFSIMGGEFSVYNIVDTVIIPIINNFSDRKISFHFTSNFSGSLNNFLNIAKTLEEKNITNTLSFSFHEEFMKIDQFLNKFQKLKDLTSNFTKLKLKINSVVDNNNFELIKDFYNQSIKLCDFVGIAINTKAKDIKPEIYEWINNIKDTASKSYLITFKDNTTEYRDKDELFTNPKGFPSKGFLCQDRLLNLKYIYGTNKFQTYCSIDEGKNNIICTKEYCRLCGRVKLIQLY